MASLTHDLLDGYADLRQSQDSRIGLLAAQIALILEVLGRGEQFRIDCRRPDRAADLAHRFADGIEESPTGVLHQMPTICDLYRVRQRLSQACAVAGSRSGNSVTIAEPKVPAPSDEVRREVFDDP